MRVMAPGRGSWKRSMTRSESFRMAASSSTASSGGRPPFDRPTDIEPRLAWKRTPISRAASTCTSTELPFL